MSLREDYSGVCTGGFHSDMALVHQAGIDFVGTTALPGTAFSAVQTALDTAATTGTKVFTVSVDTTFETASLVLGGLHQSTYFAGIINALDAEDIYSPYVTLALTTGASTAVTFSFSM